ncbi:hypothetical protein [Caloramator sp. E03]|nr:hypothetical protein [Caloramator sp. E03]
MNKNAKQIIIIFIIVAVIAAFDFTYINVFISKLIPTGHRVVVVDAGHGG